VSDTDTTPRVPIGRTLVGLMSGLLVAMLASSIVSTSLPKIVADLNGNQATLTWIVTATLLAITVSTPVWGKLSDQLSRKALLVVALIFFLIGSVTAGVAPDATWLIVGRVFQGLGAGGLLSLVQIVMADIISPRERGKYMGLFGAVMAFGTIGGPLIGGLVTDVFGWRWNFFGSAPIALFSLIVVLFTIPAGAAAQSKRVRIDYAGALLLTLGISALLIWVTLGGDLFDWGSPLSLSVLGAAVLLLVIALIVESRVAEPILPLGLFKNRGFVLTVIASISVGVSTYGATVFMSQYLQVARNASATESSIASLPQLICVTVASTVVGAMISRTGHWKQWMAAGGSAQALGLVLLGTITTTTPYPLLWVYMALVGFGIGSVMQNLVLMAENNVDARQLGVASAGVVFFRSLGGTIGLAGLGAVIAARAQFLVDDAIAKAAPSAGLHSVQLDQVSDPGTLGIALEVIVRDAYARAVGDAYLIGAVLAVICVVSILLLPGKPLSTLTRAERIAALVDEGEGL